jgi:hypothetical protein
MGGMPRWFAKTREMAAVDLYFSVQDAGSEEELIGRYLRALKRLRADFFLDNRSDALENAGSDLTGVAASIGGHFVGDWIHKRYPDSPDLGGRFWPQVASQKVVDYLRWGTMIAFHKALGRDNLERRGVDDEYIEALFESERHIDVEVNGVLPLAMSWNCVAATGEDYFEVDALRGPTVVELAIATPRPYGHGAVMPLVEEYEWNLRQAPVIDAEE